MKTQERKQWEREQRKGRIIDIAQNIFFSRGFDGATVDDIAKSAGYNKRTIYLYFNDKEDLFLAVVHRGLKLFYETLKMAIENSDDSTFKVHELAQAFYSFSIDHPEFFNLIMIYESRNHIYYRDTVDESDEVYFGMCQNMSNLSGKLVTDAISSDIKKKYIKTDLKPKQMMILLWGQIFGIMQIILMRKNLFKDTYGFTHQEFFNEFVLLTERAIAGD